MISDTKLNDTYPVDQFVVEGFSKPFRTDRNKNGGGILLFACEDILTRLISIKKAPIEIFFNELNLRRKKWIKNCSYNHHKNNISSNLEVISRTNFTFGGEFQCGCK